jgi:hypothetical protein
VASRLATDTVTFSGRKVTRLGAQRITDVFDAIARKAAAALELARFHEADVVVLVLDVDVTYGTRATVREADRKMAAMHAAAEAGFRTRGDDGPTAIFGTPCRTIESWALGDLTAVQAAAGLPDPPSIPKPAEELWGKPNDETSDHPKCVFTAIFGGSVRSEDYAATAENAPMATLEGNCPRSFAPFAAALRATL